MERTSSDASLVNKEREVNGDGNKASKSKNEGNPECAVCLQTSIHPVRLPCNHVFCYLCVKGVTNRSKRCAMCRQEIPTDFLDNPTLLPTNNSEPVPIFDDGHQWFYEGRNGWWQYDERTSVELETAYKRGENRCEALIAGFLYVVNFEHMVQMRRCDPSRRRRIKRDAATAPKKGVAGIRALSQRNADASESNAPAEENDASETGRNERTDERRPTYHHARVDDRREESGGENAESVREPATESRSPPSTGGDESSEFPPPTDDRD